MVKIAGEGELVRIFVGEADRWCGRALFEAIVLVAREMGLAGATVLRGVMGFGAALVLHSSRLLRLWKDLPIVIEVVEMAEKIAPFVARGEAMLDEATRGGLITLERAEIIRYQPGKVAEV